MSAGVRTTLYFILALICAAVICGISVLMTGAGHGWYGGMTAVFTLVSAPLAGIGWSLRGRKAGITCGGISVVINVTGDAIIVVSAVNDSYGLERVWNAMPALLVAWCALLIGSQLVGLAALFARPTPNRQ